MLTQASKRNMMRIGKIFLSDDDSAKEMFISINNNIKDANSLKKKCNL